jgi:hypothetical protein
METLLDEREYIYWETEYCVYKDNSVNIRIIELFRTNKEETMKIGAAFLKNLHKIGISENSREYDVAFDDVLFFQAYDENRHNCDSYEEYDNGVLRTYTKSHLLDFISNYTDIDLADDRMKTHYCLRTASFNFHIASHNKPTITLVKRNL